jgi:diacylglycerol kinase family enzyme
VNANDAQLIEIMTARHGSTVEDNAPNAPAPGQDPAGSYDVVIEGNAGRIDVGEVNGRVFLNNSSLGIYPAIERGQERQEEGRQQQARLMLIAQLAQPPHRRKCRRQVVRRQRRSRRVSRRWHRSHS